MLYLNLKCLYTCFFIFYIIVIVVAHLFQLSIKQPTLNYINSALYPMFRTARRGCLKLIGRLAPTTASFILHQCYVKHLIVFEGCSINSIVVFISFKKNSFTTHVTVFFRLYVPRLRVFPPNEWWDGVHNVVQYNNKQKQNIKTNYFCNKHPVRSMRQFVRLTVVAIKKCCRYQPTTKHLNVTALLLSVFFKNTVVIFVILVYKIIKH